VVAAHGVDALRTLLELTFAPLVTDVSLNEANIVDALHGMQFLPIDKRLYLRLQSTVNQTEQTFPCIDETLLFYHDTLLWSGVDQDTTRTLYRYLCARLHAAPPDAVHLLDIRDPDVTRSRAPTPASVSSSADVDDAQLGDSCEGVAPLVRGLGARRLYVWRCVCSVVWQRWCDRAQHTGARAWCARGCCGAVPSRAARSSSCARSSSRTCASSRHSSPCNSATRSRHCPCRRSSARTAPRIASCTSTT
jgi:hypothetical protein